MSSKSLLVPTLAVVQILLFLSPVLSEAIQMVSPNPKDRPICIVGGGISGLNTGIRLQEKGYKVHLFERERIPGGKMNTYRRNPDIQVEMCALIYGPSSTHILNYVKKFGLTSVLFNQTDDQPFDPDAGNILTNPAPSPAQMATIVNATARYTEYFNEYAEQLKPKHGYTNVSPDLFMPFADWLTARNLSALEDIYRAFVTISGYGALEEIPAMYALQFIGSNEMERIQTKGNMLNVAEGLDVLAAKMAGTIRNVYYGQEAVGIRRLMDLNGRWYQVLTTRDPRTGRERESVCGRTILAFPPLLNEVGKIVADLTAEEREVLAHVRIQKFTSAAHRIPTLNRTLYYMPVPRGTGEVVAVLKQNSKGTTGVYSSYSWIRGDYTREVSRREDADIERQLAATMAKLGSVETFTRKTSEFFPHVSSDSLRQGFYKKFNQIQGQGGLYYATTLLGFELMEIALRTTDAFVHTHF